MGLLAGRLRPPGAIGVWALLKLYRADPAAATPGLPGRGERFCFSLV